MAIKAVISSEAIPGEMVVMAHLDAIKLRMLFSFFTL
jgi:hypothetical protein